MEANKNKVISSFLASTCFVQQAPWSPRVVPFRQDTLCTQTAVVSPSCSRFLRPTSSVCRRTHLPPLRMLTAKAALHMYSHWCLLIPLRAVSHHPEPSHLSCPEPSLSLLVSPLRASP